MCLFATKLAFWLIFTGFLVVCDEDAERKLNVVLFFTHVDVKNDVLKQDSLEFLNFEEKSRVKHDTLELAPKPDEKKGSTYCKEYLKNSLLTLTKYCHTVRKMKTAIASVSSKEVTNDIQEPEGPYHNPAMHMGEEVIRVKRADDKKSDDDEVLQSNWKDSKGIITGANRHTEIFEIRLRKREVDDKPKEVEIIVEDEVPVKTSTDKSWDVLDVMKHVRYSFLGNMLKDTLKNDINADKDDFADIEHIGKHKEDAGLFNMVKSTLEVLVEPPETPFLLVVFGGHLSAIKDKQSPMVSSIKHVVEMTDMSSTLIVVTGSCAEDIPEEDRDINKRSCTMPLYAKGPRSDMLAECKLLYDIPLTVRKILEIEAGEGIQLEIEKQDV